MTPRSARARSRTTEQRVLVDASNLHVGGGVQVAASFIDELGCLVSDESFANAHPWVREARFELSTSVFGNLQREPWPLDVNCIDRRPGRPVLPHRPRGFDVSFTVFGPTYGGRRACRSIIGFADGLALWPEFSTASGLAQRTRFAVRRRFARRFFVKGDRLVVEATHVADALAERWGVDPSAINVVPNVVNAAVLAKGQKDLLLPPVRGIRLAYPTRPYRHKNLGILGQVGNAYLRRYGQRLEFLLTLSASEMQALDPQTRDFSLTVGPLRVGDLPRLYAGADGVVFPSLIESFSVTPLEAAAAGRPLFASDRAFVREIMGDGAFYFSPEDPEEIAEVIRRIVADPGEVARRVAIASKVVEGWPSGRDRALAYVGIVDEVLRA